MEMNPIGIVILLAVVAFGVYKVFFSNKEAPVVKASKPAPAVKTVKAPVVKEDVVKLPSKTALNKMTKKELDLVAQVDFGITLDARVTKDKMIAALQKEVKAQKK